jgi:hypothetical protein
MGKVVRISETSEGCLSGSCKSCPEGKAACQQELARFSLLSHSFYLMALAGLTPFIAAPTTPAGTPLQQARFL